ncbi:MAG TPA: hypothetical protein V6D03_04410, partial [Candidatus Caenarcaniphilales bacterium]
WLKLKNGVMKLVATVRANQLGLLRECHLAVGLAARARRRNSWGCRKSNRATGGTAVNEFKSTIE